MHEILCDVRCNLAERVSQIVHAQLRQAGKDSGSLPAGIENAVFEGDVIAAEGSLRPVLAR